MEELKELRVSNDAMNDPEELRHRISEDGYLFFKKLQDPDKLWALRREMLTTMQEGGWLVAGHRSDGRHRRYIYPVYRGGFRVHRCIPRGV